MMVLRFPILQFSVFPFRVFSVATRTAHFVFGRSVVGVWLVLGLVCSCCGDAGDRALTCSRSRRCLTRVRTNSEEYSRVS